MAKCQHLSIVYRDLSFILTFRRNPVFPLRLLLHELLFRRKHEATYLGQNTYFPIIVDNS